MKEKSGLSQRSQKILIFLSWLMYTSAYLGRYSYNSNINPIMTDFGVNHAGAGLVTTCFFFAYGAGQVVNGLLCKRYNKKYVLSIAMIISSAINIAFFIGVDFALVKYMWFVNGAVQSVLWSSLILSLSENLDSDNLKKAILVMSTTVAIGTFLSYGGSAFFVHIGNYRFSFLMGGAVTALVGITWLVMYGRIAKERNELSAENSETVSDDNPIGKTAGGGVIAVISILAFFAVINNLVKDGLNTWVPSILKESYGLDDSLSILLTLVLPVLGVFGATFAMFMSHKLKSYVSICGISFAGAMIFVLAVILLFKTTYWLPIILCFGVVVLAMHAINNVITSMAPLYMRDKVNSGMVAGVLDGFCYAGSTVSSYGLGVIADKYGWSPVFYLFLSLMGVSVVVSIVYRIVTRKIEN